MKKTIKIMLVQDDKNLGLILTSYLTVKGYPTALCLDALEALDHFENDPSPNLLPPPAYCSL